MKRKWILFIGLLFLLNHGQMLFSFGAEKEPSVPGVSMDEFDFSGIEEFVREKQDGQGPGFGEIMELLMAGEFDRLWNRALEALKKELFSEIASGGRFMGQILALGILGAVFTNFSDIFSGSQISDTGFYVTYLLLFTMLLAGISQSIQVAADTVEEILTFMKVLMPSYFLVVAFAGGSVSAAAMYEFTLLIISVGQWLLGAVLIPAARVYLLLVFANHMAKEELLSRLTELTAQAIGWGMKTILGVVLGFHLIEGMVLPYVDSLKNGSVQKLVEMIPGVGQGAAAVTQMILGSGVLIKNTMGMAAVVILLMLIAVPVMKLAVLMLLYKCMAALMEPVCDKRLVKCVAAMAKGHKMLLQIVGTAAALLVITVAVVCGGTNVVYFGG
ncbi:MAG: sporulation protein [Hungatella sp.]|nr:sporulation protein [Hungatella sp.]